MILDSWDQAIMTAVMAGIETRPGPNQDMMNRESWDDSDGVLHTGKSDTGVVDSMRDSAAEA